MSGSSVGDVKIILNQIHSQLADTSQLGNAAATANNPLGARLVGAKSDAEQLLKILENAHRKGEEALVFIRGIEAQTPHPEPPEIALYISRGLEQVERALTNTRNILSHHGSLDDMIRWASETKIALPSTFFDIAKAKTESYSARL